MVHDAMPTQSTRLAHADGRSEPTPASISADRFDLGTNSAWGAVPAPLLSVLVPFYETSPLPLLRALTDQAADVAAPVELIFADDGSRDQRHGAAVRDALLDSVTPGAVLTARYNVGRAAIRNELARTARGRYLLFIDCDLQPARPDFLARWTDMAAAGTAEIGYGGFRMRPSDECRDRLHAYYSARSDCLPAAARQCEPAKYTYTNNLLVARDVALAEPFDERFSGWGWEDVEWALRVEPRWTIRHIENPVLNPADGTARSLLRKFTESVGNFALLRRLHPDAVATFPIFRVSRLLALLPLLSAALPLLEIVAVDSHDIFPMQLRYYALKLYRAFLYGTAHDIDEA